MNIENVSKELQEYYEFCASNLSEQTTRSYFIRLRKFEQWFQRNWNTVTIRDLVTFLNLVNIKSLKAGTRKNYVKVFKSMVHFLWLNEKISDSDYLKVKDFKAPRVEKGNVPSWKWALSSHQLINSLELLVEPYYWMLFWTGSNNGLRAQEYQFLKKEHINFDEKILVIKNSKMNKTREIPILTHHIPIWKNWINTIENYYNMSHDFVFGRRIVSNQLDLYGKKYSDPLHRTRITEAFKHISSILFPLLKKTLSSHTLRFSYATNLYLNAVDIYVIKEMLGHDSIKTTQNYLMIKKGEIQDRYRQMLEY